MRNYAWIVLLALLLLPLRPAISAEPFTQAQLEVIKKLLDEQRELIREEILAELKAEQSGTTAKIDGEGPLSIDLDDDDRSSGGATKPLDVTLRPISNDLDVVPQDRGMRPGISGLELETNGDDEEVRATIAHSWSTGIGTPHVGETGWSLTASSPLDDKKNNRGHFSTLDGLVGGFGLKFALTHATTKRIEISDQSGVPSHEWEALCGLAGLPGAKGCTLGVVHKAAREKGDRALREAYDAFANRNYGWGYIYEARIGGARKEYEFLGADLVEIEDTRNAWSVGGSIGITTPRRQALYALGFDFQRDYKEQEDERVYCPEPASSPTVCIPGRLGEPERGYKRLLWAEARSRFFRFPFAFRVTQDLQSNTTGADLPIYFFRGEGKPFAGGIRLGWNSEDGADGGIFVSSDFDVFK